MFGLNSFRYSFNIGLIALLGCLYAALVIIPFYAYGLHLQPDITGGLYDSNGLTQFYSSLGGLPFFIGFFSMIIFPVLYVFVGSLIVLYLIRSWQSISLWKRNIGVTVLCLSAALFIFEFSPMGQLIWLWLAD